MPHAASVVVELLESTEDVVVWVVSELVEEPIVPVDDCSPEGPSSPQPTSNETHNGTRMRHMLGACHEHDASMVAMIARRAASLRPGGDRSCVARSSTASGTTHRVASRAGRAGR